MKLVHKTGTSKANNHFGVIETACYPCTYYGGMIQGEQPVRNDADSFFETVTEAMQAAEKALKDANERFLKL